MTIIQTNSGLNLNTSYFQSIKQSLGLEPTFSTRLLDKLKNENALSPDTLQEVVGYLADHADAKLEQALKEKLAILDSPKILEKVKSVCMSSLQKGHLKMLEVCQRIVSFDQLKSGSNGYDPMAIAKRESSLIPAPTRTIEKISDTAIQNWPIYSSIFGKILNWVKNMTWAIILALINTLSYPINNSFTNFTGIQGYLKNCRSMLDGFKQLTTSYLEFFATTKTAALAGIVILISASSIHYIHQRFRLGIPEIIDQREHCKNTSLEAKNGEFKEMKGRQTEKETVKTAWNVPKNEKFRIPLLVGPQGSGKTEFVNALAWESVNDPTSFVYGKKIFSINTVKLTKDSLREILANIKEHEDDIILFFDECHTAGAVKGKPAPLLEALKTDLLKSNVRAIFATTNKEYEANIAHNEPFVSRCIKIDFKALPKEESKKILKDKVELDVDREIEVDANAYDALLLAASLNSEGCNPRELINLYINVRDFVYSWTPKTLIQQLDRLTIERDDLKAQCQTANNDPDWSNSDNGIALLNALEKKEGEIQRVTQKLKTQKVALDQIARLRKLGPQLRKRYNELVHQVAATANENLQKEFLYLKHVLRPALQATLEAEAKKLKETYKEELPLKIDAAVVQKLYPAAFRSRNDSASNSPRSETPNETTISSSETLSV